MTRIACESVEKLIANLLLAWNSHDIERIAAFYASDYEGIDIGEATPRGGSRGIRHTASRYLAAFPDLTFSQDSAIIQGNQVSLCWTARGTHRGRLMNIPPTGRAVEIKGVSLLTLEGNKVRRAFYLWDVAGMLRSFGLLPELQ